MFAILNFYECEVNPRGESLESGEFLTLEDMQQLGIKVGDTLTGSAFRFVNDRFRLTKYRSEVVGPLNLSQFR